MIKKLDQIKNKYWAEITQASWLLLILTWLLFPFISGLTIELAISFSLFLIFLHVSDISNRSKNKSVTTCLDRSEQLKYLIEYAQSNQIVFVRGIFGSAMWFRNYAEMFIREDADIQILMQHPDHAINDEILSGIKAFMSYSHHGKKRIKIFFYRDIPAYEGVLVNKNFLSSSWYTYYHDNSDSQNILVRGSSNLKVITYGPSVDYKNSRDMFDKKWKDLIESAISIEDYCNQDVQNKEAQKIICQHIENNSL